QLKKWNRKWKLALIENSNPQWQDLYHEVTGSLDSASSAE
ncbi:MAG: GIY-YIG nuclease family protein, partial [Chloroflexi bacterium]